MKVLIVLLAAFLTGCAGVRKIGKVSIERESTLIRGRVPAKAHAIHVTVPRVHNQNANGYVTNLGSKPFCAFRLVFADQLDHKGHYLEKFSEKVWIMPGEEKKVFTGPLHLVMCTFCSLPSGGAKFSFRVVLDSPPPTPIRSDFIYSYGGP